MFNTFKQVNYLKKNRFDTNKLITAHNILTVNEYALWTYTR